MVSISSYITKSSAYQGVKKACRSIKQKGLDILPNAEYASAKINNGLEYIGKNFSSDKQRLALGLTAIVTQPVIDAHNKDVDEKTRKVSVARTISKIIAGTTTGFLIRYGCIKGIKAFSQIPKAGIPKYKSIFTPKGLKNNNTEAFEQYRNAMGTIVALVVMMFTNFLIDAPLTKFLTNHLISKQENKS